MITWFSDNEVWQRWKALKRFALLAIFEDSVTGRRAKEFCQALTRDLGKECQVIEHVWLFNTLGQREMREIAAEEAAGADLVIISVHQAEDLPDDVKNWVDLWLRRKGSRQGVLLALFDPADEEASGATEAYLQDVARRGGMEFLVQSADLALTYW